MISISFFRKNGASTNTSGTGAATATHMIITPQPLGLKNFSPDDDDGGADRLRRSHRVDRSRVMSRSSSPPPPPPPLAAAAEPEDDNACWASYGRGHFHKLPPPMPLLARTAKLSSRMPWRLERTHRADGSLVIREVRAERHEYLRARRGDGRLTLALVQLSPREKEKETTAAAVHSESSQSTSEVDCCRTNSATVDDEKASSVASPTSETSSTATSREPTVTIRMRTGVALPRVGSSPRAPLCLFSSCYM